MENDRNLVANFAAKQLCHISVSVGSEGTGTVTATCGGEPVESALEGSEITVSATHAEGYVFLNWTENGRPVSTSSTYTFTLESDRSLVANFTQYTYVPVTSLPTPTTDPLYVIGYQDGDDFYLIDWGGDYQRPMHLSKNPDNPLYFHFAFESGETFRDFTCAKVGHYYYLKIEEGHAFVSTFFAGDDEQPYMIEFSPNGDIYSRGSHNNALYHDGDIVKTHYYTSPDNLRFFRLTRYYPVIVSASPAEGGTVSATCDGHEVTQALEGATVTVTATPAEGYMFKNWTEYGRIVSTDNPYSFGIGDYCNLVANFVEPQYDFSATCETGQTLYYRINDAEQHWVSIVAPLGDDPSGWGSSKPKGNIVLPQTVIHDGIEYVVTEIGDYAFYNCRDLRGLLDIPVTVTRIGDFAFYDEGWINTTLSIPDQVKSIGASAFKNRFIESIYIGNSVESIGSEALCVFDNTDRHFVSKAQTPPDFEGGFIYMYFPHQTQIYIHIPKNTLAAYQSAWGDKYDYIEMNDCAFWPGIYDMWQFWENWRPNQQLPAPYDNVTIYGNCLLDVDATVSELRVAAGKTLTIGAGKTLTAVSIILENGAQLINNGTVNCNDITVTKAIEDYGEDSGGWYLVSSPVTASAYTSGMATAPAENYDLYRFDQTGDSQGREWLNYKAGAFLMENQSGYLHANKNNMTIVFRGGFAATSTKELEYVEGEGVDFPGFNLVGNPYPCNATISGTNLRSSNYYYMMNANGTNLEVVTNPILPPCTGVFAVAANSDATVTFTQANTTGIDVTRSEKNAVQDIRVELLADGKVIDRTYLNMNGESLPKFRLQDNASGICFYQNKEELAVASTDATRGEMPLNFKAAKNGSYTITVNVDNADLNYLHLVDNLTGNDVDLMGDGTGTGRDVPWRVSTQDPTYTFDAKTGDYASRFKLVFGVNGDAASAGSAGNFAFISNGEIIVSNEGRATLQVIDVLGRIISSEEINGECRISTNGMTAGVYILNLNGKTQKIVVK
ncbi:MAG: leucine-rich repeat protein [Bacteroidales bacterium]|nr:leucine-rich repeat protein [Bacteroidales bacterium]